MLNDKTKMSKKSTRELVDEIISIVDGTFYKVPNVSLQTKKSHLAERLSNQYAEAIFDILELMDKEANKWDRASVVSHAPDFGTPIRKLSETIRNALLHGKSNEDSMDAKSE